jgi:hypothetical protein
MRVPSGDHAGWSSRGGPLVSWTTSVPSASMTKRSVSVKDSFGRTKAIRPPSGDQAGDPPVPIVRTLEPSASARTSSRFRTSASREPSGDQAGSDPSRMRRRLEPSGATT